MKSKIIFTVMAGIYLLRAVGLLFAPQKFFEMYGCSLDTVGTWSAQFIGGAMLFISLINWFASRNTGNPFLRNVIITNIIFEIISVCLAIKGASLFNSLVWVAISLDMLLLLLFAYLLYSLRGDKK
jgi:hypothetical protein